jgi:hypothetical protein
MYIPFPLPQPPSPAHRLTTSAIRSKHISSSAKLFGTSKHEKILNDFYDSGAAKLCPPDNSAHISSHNAVKGSSPLPSPLLGLQKQPH